MRWKYWLILAIQAALVVLLATGVRTGLTPLGVRGEWQWMRLPEGVKPQWDWFALSAAGVAAYAAFVGIGLRALSRAVSRWAEARWLALLLAVAVAVQFAVPVGAPDEYDLTKWAYVNYFRGSSGYFQIARLEAAHDPWRFLAQYPEWIRDQDALHIGTHPPGLIVAQSILLRTMDRSPALARLLNDLMPPSVRLGFRTLVGPGGASWRTYGLPRSVQLLLRKLEELQRPPLRRAEQASLYATALLTLLACAGTVVPLYLLARASMPAPWAWAAAALWPPMPAANLFQPVSDTTYPLLSTMAWALAAWAALWHHRASHPSIASLVLAGTSGLVMAFGMAFTLAFLPVGLIVALLILTDQSLRLRSRAALIVATGAGFLALTLAGWLIGGANPFVVWSWNLHHHARFYNDHPRTYSIWLWANGIELSIAIGLPTVVWFIAGLLRPRNVPRVVWATLFVLVVVNLTGRNMGEVARLWLLYTPPLLIAAAAGLERLAREPVVFAISTGLVGCQTLALQSMIQVVYPV